VVTPATFDSVRRAVGIVRVSQVSGREGESFISPREQADRIGAACERERLQLLEIHEELDVSGGAPLDKRPGLSQAVGDIEAGQAEVLVVAYFDRLARELSVQTEIVTRVERAGGAVLAVDLGAITHATAAQWLSGTLLGAFNEYQRRTTKERSAEAQLRAVARGVPPFANVPPGLRRREDGTLEADPQTIDVVTEAFAMRADNVPIREIRAFLAMHGIQRSHHGVQHMLTSRLYVGEIHFGKLENLAAHEPVIDLDLWKRTQRAYAPRGRQAKSDRLLARVGVLRCGSCGAAMVAGTSDHGRYANYRCPPTNDCTRRVTISAQVIEAIVERKVIEAIADEQGRASVESDAREAEVAAQRAQEALDAAVRAFTGLEEEQSARERLEQLRTQRDRTREAAVLLGSQRAALVVSAADWPRLSLQGKRAIIAAVVQRVDVLPGRGAERIRVHLVGE
jgi:site-specific DNA recombinase